MELQLYDNKRNGFIDYLRGIAITLVILGHCIQFGQGNDYYVSGMFFDSVLFKVIYSFHMPLFTLISGYCMGMSLNGDKANRPLGTLFLKQIKRILIPIIVWTTLFNIAEAAKLILVNGDTSYSEIFTNELTRYITDFWFLWAILVCSIIVILCLRLSNTTKVIVFTVLVIIGMLIPTNLWAQLTFVFPYYVLGYMWYSKNSKPVTMFEGKKGIVYLVVSGVAWIGMLLFYTKDSYVYTTGISVIGKPEQIFNDLFRWVIGLFGCVYIVGVVYFIYSINILKKLVSYLGTKTMGIYIMSSYIFIFLPRILRQVSSKWGWIYIIFEVIGILVVTVVATMVIEKSHIGSKLLLGKK